MALDDKKYEKFYNTTGTGKDKATDDELAKIEALWDLDKAEGCEWYLSHPEYGPLIFQLQQMQDEISALRDEISDNKDKAGVTTTQANRITANHAKVGITTSQASAITANSAKAPMVLGTTNKTALAGNTTTISTEQAATVNNLHLEGGALIPTTTAGHTVSLSVTNNKGKYSLVFTMVDSTGKNPVTKTLSVLMS